MTTIRSFIAIDLSPAARTALADLQNRLKPLLPRHTVRWAVPQNIHLTLHFLGDVETTVVDKIAESLATEAVTHQAFALDLVGLGCFPNSRRPRIIWVGLGGETGPLIDLHRALGQRLNQAIGFTPETRPYAPHLTIGRVKKGLPQRQLTQLGPILTREQAAVGHLARLTVTQVSLFQSELTPTGPIYTPLAHGPLNSV